MVFVMLVLRKFFQLLLTRFKYFLQELLPPRITLETFHVAQKLDGHLARRYSLSHDHSIFVNQVVILIVVDNNFFCQYIANHYLSKFQQRSNRKLSQWNILRAFYFIFSYQTKLLPWTLCATDVVRLQKKRFFETFC